MRRMLTLRPATIEDAELLLSWRNDPETRARSHNSNQVEMASHVAWLADTLGNPTRQLFVAEKDGVPVGTSRADFDGSCHELSWTVAPEFRCSGIGKAMVAMLAERVAGPIRAEIKTGHTASVKIAEFAGLRLDREDAGVLHYWLHR